MLPRDKAGPAETLSRGLDVVLCDDLQCQCEPMAAAGRTRGHAASPYGSYFGAPDLHPAARFPVPATSVQPLV